MKFQSCRWKHFDVTGKCHGFSTADAERRTANDELVMTMPRVFSENSPKTAKLKINDID
ncbi:hypothetical protein DPMN_051468 [Dreissena polymorpha]|uniref:Uncharacterized protein n=1 Tax=Dreissena polymorpha TaxID=45954 RepID=A0A9D4HNY4_DREPO|nr:hypothetical protein DPMN_051468 [Dreissena polymorpha]